MNNYFLALLLTLPMLGAFVTPAYPYGVAPPPAKIIEQKVSSTCIMVEPSWGAALQLTNACDIGLEIEGIDIATGSAPEKKLLATSDMALTKLQTESKKEDANSSQQVIIFAQRAENCKSAETAVAKLQDQTEKNAALRKGRQSMFDTIKEWFWPFQYTAPKAACGHVTLPGFHVLRISLPFGTAYTIRGAFNRPNGTEKVTIEGKIINPNDTGQALDSYTEAAEKGDVDAMVKLARFYADKKDDAASFGWYAKAAEQGNADAQYRAGYLYETGTGAAQSDAEAAKWYKKASLDLDQRGRDSWAAMAAKCHLAGLYLFGGGGLKDEAAAFKLLEMPPVDIAAETATADNGDVQAQLRLGNLYRDINQRCRRMSGAEPDKAAQTAIQWYHLAAEQGNAEAKVEFGKLYDPMDIPGRFSIRKEMAVTNPATAHKLYVEAAAEGNAEAQFMLARQYETGRGAKQDFYRALALFRQSAKNGDPLGQEVIGNYYYMGEAGEIKDWHMAYYWYMLAQRQGRGISKNRINNIRLQLSRQEIDAIEKDAAAWVKPEKPELTLPYSEAPPPENKEAPPPENKEAPPPENKEAAPAAK